MQCIVYVKDNSDISIYQKFNECARVASRYGYSIKGRMLDFSGKEFYKTIDKVVFDNEVNALIVYNLDSVGDYETILFYRIYLEKLGKKLIACN